MAKDKKTIKYEANISGFKKNIETAENSIKTLNNQLKLNQAQLKGNGNSTELLGKRVEQLKEKYQEQTTIVENTTKEYEKAVEVYGENSKEAENLKNKLIQAETKQQSIANAIKETNNQLTLQTDKLITAGTKMQNFGDSTTKLGEKLDKIGNKLSIVSAGITTIAGTSIKASIDYESAWTGVTKTVDGTEEQMSQLREGILELSTQLPTAATEIAAVAENAGQLGIQTDNVLSFSKAMIDLGNSTNLTADEAASQLAKFANITEMSQKDFEKLGSSIVDLGNNFATTEADIVNMAMRLAGAGHQVGMSQGQILGIATALSSVGIEAEMGGSAISKAMVKMQNAVEQGGTKLDDVLKKTGMSLRDLELLSANNSKDFKALADSIGMTSTEVKQLITAGTNLEDFAKVSGMTAEEFKKAWKEDASGALSAFIKGLGDAENKGESAITMLSEMGLTEVRLRDSLLRAANAGDLFNNAISMGTKAWNENVALANEANKRYDTTESKLQMLKNEIVKNGIALGDELKPVLVEVLEEVKPMISNVTSMVKLFNKLDETTKKNIINFGAFVVALGPVTKIGGKVISTIGSSVKSLGTLTKAIGVFKTGTSSGIKEVDSLAKGITNLLSPIGLATTSITILAAGIAYQAAKQAEATKETREAYEEMKNQREAYEEYNQSIDKTRDANLAQIDSVSRLKDELKTLVDENGKVKEGYESRVDFILNQLKETLGIECQLNDGVIQSYQDLQGEIDKTIEKKKTEVILESGKEKWAKANEEEKESIKKTKEAYDELGTSLEGAKKKLEDLKYKRDEISILHNEGNGTDFWTYQENKNLQTDIDNLENLIKKIEEGEAVTKKCGEEKKEYENNYALYVEGKYNEIGNTIVNTTEKWTDASLKEIEDSIKKEKESFNDYKEMYERDGNEVVLQRQKQAEANLQNLANELVSRTKTIGTLGEEEKSAWRTLAINSYDEYQKAISKVGPTMQDEIQKATGVVVAETPYAKQVAENYINSVMSSLDKDEEFRRKALESLNGYLLGLSDEEKREFLKQAGVQDVDKVIEGLNEGKQLSEEQGVKILEGLKTGLQDNGLIISAINQAKNVASKIAGALSINVPSILGKTVSNAAQAAVLPGHKDGLDYVPYDNYVARLHKGERVLTAEENKRYMNHNINNKLATNNVTVQFFPQSMSEVEMERAFNYIDKKYGKLC